MQKTSFVTSKQEVIEILKNNLDRFTKFGVDRVGLFGSFVREEQTLHSDVDILVNLTNPDFYNYCNLIDFAESLFPDREVDIVTEDSVGCNGMLIYREVEYI